MTIVTDLSLSYFILTEREQGISIFFPDITNAMPAQGDTRNDRPEPSVRESDPA